MWPGLWESPTWTVNFFSWRFWRKLFVLRKRCQCLYPCVGYFDESCLCWENVINVCVYIGGKRTKKSGQWFQSGLWFQSDGKSVVWMLSCLGCPYLSLLRDPPHPPWRDNPRALETVLYTYDVVCIECIIVSVFVVVSSCPFGLIEWTLNFELDAQAGYCLCMKYISMFCEHVLLV